MYGVEWEHFCTGFWLGHQGMIEYHVQMFYLIKYIRGQLHTHICTVRVVALSRMERSCTSEAEDDSPGPVSPDTELYFGPNPTPRYMLQEKSCQALHMERSSE